MTESNQCRYCGDVIVEVSEFEGIQTHLLWCTPFLETAFYLNMAFFTNPKVLERMIKEATEFFDKNQSEIFKMLSRTSDRASLKQTMDNAKRNWKLE